ncbi:MAG TPA: hypothetical protein VMX33_08565 [bacterium]|nr:hypothetical protein [bacterium]
MARDLDVHQLLKTFAARNKSAAIEYAAFAQAIQRQAKANDQSVPFYRDLALHPDTIIVPKLFQLAREKRISLQAVDNRVDRVFLPEAFTEPVYAEYRRIEENPDIPFPDENSLHLSVPPEWLQAVSVESDLPTLVTLEGDRPVPLYRLVFPESLKPILVLSVAVGDKLLEYAVLKIRNYLRKGSNRDFIQQRLYPAFSDKERILKDGLTSIMIRPFESIQEMRQGTGDFSYSFWAYLTSAIRKDLAGKGDMMPDDVAAFQASYIVDVYNNHFKNRAQVEQDRLSAFKTLSELLRKPPYLFVVDDIVDFRDTQGRPLLGKYTREELESWILERTTQAVEGSLPELLLIGADNMKSQIIVKERLLPYLVKALREARTAIRPAVIRDWHAVLADFESLPSMEDDQAFRAELWSRLSVFSPVLSVILSTALPPLVFQEFRNEKDSVIEIDQCFGGNRVAGAEVLLDLNRKRLLAEARTLLPLWYSLPLISWLVALFSRGSRRKKRQRSRNKEPAFAGQAQLAESRVPNARSLEFGQAAKAAEQKMLPQGYSLDEYLSFLVSRWNTLIDPVAKDNLTEDINSLVRDFLRATLRSMRPSSFTPDRIEMMAANLADRPNLLRIRNHTALEEYIRLYMVKVLKR